MTTRYLLALSATLLVAADPPKDEAAAKDLKALQGGWAPVSLESGGHRATPAELAKTVGKLKIDGDDISLEIWGSRGNGKFKLDPSTKPKSMDMVKAGSPPGLAIYELNGDNLRICFQVEDGKPRPSEFTSKDAFVIIGYKRSKP